MSIRMHQVLMRVFYPLGMITGFLSLPLVLWCVYALRFPSGRVRP